MSVPPKKYRCTGCEKSLNENNRCPNRVASFSTEQISKTVLKFLNRVRSLIIQKPLQLIKLIFIFHIYFFISVLKSLTTYMVLIESIPYAQEDTTYDKISFILNVFSINQ